MTDSLSSQFPLLKQLTQSQAVIAWIRNEERWNIGQEWESETHAQFHRLTQWEDHQQLLTRCWNDGPLKAEMDLQEQSIAGLILLKDETHNQVLELINPQVDLSLETLQEVLSKPAVELSSSHSPNFQEVSSAFLTASSATFKHHLLLKQMATQPSPPFKRIWGGVSCKQKWESIVVNDVWPVEQTAVRVRELQAEVQAFLKQSQQSAWKELHSTKSVTIQSIPFGEERLLIKLHSTKNPEQALLYLLESHTTPVESALSPIVQQLHQCYSEKWLNQLQQQTHSTILQRRKTNALLGLISVAILLTILFLIPVPMRVLATGSLQPAHRTTVFAPWEGTIQSESLTCEFGSQLQQGSLICQMESLELKLQIQQYSGELATANEQLTAAQANRLMLSSSPTAEKADPLLLTARVQELETTIASTKTKLQLLEGQLQQAEIIAPITGQVMTRNLKSELENRPVQRGTPLLTIADFNGDWEVELEINEADLPYLQAALTNVETLPVSVNLLGQPDQFYQAHLKSLKPVAHQKQDSRRVILATCRLEQNSQAKAAQAGMAGVSVLGRIDCESTSLWNWMTYRMTDTLKQRLKLWWSGS